MFVKKEFSEEELKQKRVELNESLEKAKQKKTELLRLRSQKLKDHSNKVSQIRDKDKNFEFLSNENLKRSIESNSIFLENINNTNTIEDFQEFMQQNDTVLKASKMVELLEKYAMEESYESIKSRPKIFMSLALLSIFPEEVMPEATHEEKRLVDSAKNLFSHIIEFLDPKIEYSTKKHQDISWIWIHTIHIFDKWFVEDKYMLLQKMSGEFVCWTKTIGNMQNIKSSHVEWEPHALKYQNEILKRISEIFGKEAIEKLSQDVINLNKTFKNAELSIIFDKDQKTYMCKWIAKNQNNILESMETEIYEKVKSTNIRILHELMLKENFVDFENILKLSGKSMLEISEANKTAIMKLISILGQETSSIDISSALHELFKFICMSLLDLAGDNEDYRQEIALVDCSIDSNSWVSDSCTLLNYVLGMCRKCCAPARDKSCCDLEACISAIDKAESSSVLSESFTNTFTLLFDLLNGMRSDFCNFRLRYLAAQIEGKGIAEKYELENFEKKFVSGHPKTEKWLISEQKKGFNLKPLEILINSFLRMFDPEMDELIESEMPETFYMDFDRISRYRIKLKTTLILEAAMVYFKNYIKSSKKSPETFEKILKNLQIRLQNVSDHEEIQKIYLQSLQNVSESDEVLTLTKGNLMRLFLESGVDKVFKLLKNRKFSKIRLSLMSEQKKSEDELTDKIGSLFFYNKLCFSEIYNKIILEK